MGISRHATAHWEGDLKTGQGRLDTPQSGLMSGTAAVTGRPAFVQAFHPPSSTATAPWPSQRSIHHSRAAYGPPLAS